MMMSGPIGVQPQKDVAVIAPKNFPAAVGGLNKRDGLADMDDKDALILENLIPRPSWVELRNGYASFSTGMTGAVRSLMEWAGPSSRKLFAVNAGNIYDVSAGGAVGAADVSGLNSSDFQWINFATSGGNFLLAVSGSDAPQNYNGTAWATTPAITGVTAADLIYVSQWKSRLWFVEKNSKNAWYLPVNSIGGAATKLDLGSQFKMGGFLVAISSVSTDAGDGLDDFIAFLSDQGEVVIYQGTDPSSATTFALKTRIIIGAPVSGRRMMFQVGGDCAVISIDGVVSLIKMMNLDRSVATRESITNKIQELFNQYARDYRTNYGWQGQIYPLGSYVLFNIPKSSTEYVQLVMNTETGSWCTFTNQNGICWSLYNDGLYFGGTDGVVYKADSTRMDNGSSIQWDYQSAWSQFGSIGRVKIFQEGASLIASNGSPAILLAMNTDFVDQYPTGTITSSTQGNSLWGIAQWGIGVWGGIRSILRWFSFGAVGTWGSIRMRGIGNGILIRINSFTVTIEQGSVH